MSEFVGYDPSLNNMAQEYQLAQQGQAIGPQPGQHYSGYPPQGQPQVTTTSASQHFTANQRQQHGSHVHHQGTYPVPSAGYGVVQPHYTGPGAFQAPNVNQNMVLGPVENLNVNHQINNQAYYTPAVATAPNYGGPPQVGHGMDNAADPTSYSNLDPGLFASTPQAHHPQAYHPQVHHPQAYHPQVHHPQAYHPQVHHPQAYHPQVHHPQAYHPQVHHPQAHHPQAHHPQLAIPQATTLQEVSPQPGVLVPGTQQPNIPQAKTPRAHVPQAATQLPPPTFEEQKAYFRPIPEPHAELFRTPGPGRKKKYQRWWAPEGASDDLKRQYETLRTCDERVNGAEKRLAANKKPSQTEHLQKIVLRNIQKREDAWVECDRMEAGIVAVQLDLEEAGPRAKQSYQAWLDLDQRVQIREQSLRMRYGLAGDAIIDTTQLRKEDRQGLQTMVNWRDNKKRSLLKSLATLQDAINRTYAPPPEGRVERLKLIHGLGIYPAWSSWIWPSDSPQDVAQRQKYADPDPSTWDASEPAFWEQAQAEHPHNLQLRNGQAAEYPHANLGNGAEIDQTAGIVAQPAQYQQQPQIPQERLVPFNEEDTMAGTVSFAIEEPPVFEDNAQQLRDKEDAELLAPIAAWNRQHDLLQKEEAAVDVEMAGIHITHEEGMDLIQDFFQDKQPGQPQQQLEEGSISETVANMESQELTMTDDMELEAGKDHVYESDSESLASFTLEDAEAELDAYEDEEAGVEFKDVPLPPWRPT